MEIGYAVHTRIHTTKPPYCKILFCLALVGVGAGLEIAWPEVAVVVIKQQSQISLQREILISI
jgi:hypothetical protein